MKVEISNTLAKLIRTELGKLPHDQVANNIQEFEQNWIKAQAELKAKALAAGKAAKEDAKKAVKAVEAVPGEIAEKAVEEIGHQIGLDDLR